MYDTVLAVGMEKLFHPDKKKTFNAIGSAIDLELADEFARQMSGNKLPGLGSHEACSWIIMPTSLGRIWPATAQLVSNLLASPQRITLMAV